MRRRPALVTEMMKRRREREQTAADLARMAISSDFPPGVRADAMTILSWMAKRHPETKP